MYTIKTLGVGLLLSVFLSVSSQAQEIRIDEFDTKTDGHFADIYVKNVMPSMDRDHVFETAKGTVQVHYETYGYENCEANFLYKPPRHNAEDCPDYFWVEVPEGVLANPSESYVYDEIESPHGNVVFPAEEIKVELRIWLGG